MSFKACVVAKLFFAGITMQEFCSMARSLVIFQVYSFIVSFCAAVTSIWLGSVMQFSMDGQTSPCFKLFATCMAKTSAAKEIIVFVKGGFKSFNNLFAVIKRRKIFVYSYFHTTFIPTRLPF